MDRLQKILSRSGVASRRAAERMIQEGRVTVNGDPVTTLGVKADLAKDDIRVDGVRVRPPKAPVYLLLNKPRGVVTTRSDPAGRPTVMDLVPRLAGLFPVGRLDITTEGLILLTNDGDFALRVSHPRYELARIYHAKVRGVPTPETLARLTRGIFHEGERLAADRARLVEADNNAWVEVSLHEGKKHEVRRLLEAAGHPVSKLKRVALGPLTARGLEPGQFRALEPREVAALLRGGSGPAPDLARVRPRRRPRQAQRGRRPATSDGAARQRGRR